MTAFDEPRALNRSVLIDLIYALQTDLQILTETLARDPEPVLSDQTRAWLAGTSAVLQQSTPARRQ